MIDWGESGIAREKDGFDVRCKGVYFNGNMQTGAWKRIRRSVSQVKRKMSGGM